MLLVTFTKNWWKSLTKSDDNQEKEISELTNTEFMTDKEKTADDLLATEEPEIEKELFVPPDINEQLDVKLSSDVDEQDLDADDEDSEEEDSFTHQGVLGHSKRSILFKQLSAQIGQLSHGQPAIISNHSNRGIGGDIFKVFNTTGFFGFKSFGSGACHRGPFLSFISIRDY